MNASNIGAAFVAEATAGYVKAAPKITIVNVASTESILKLAIAGIFVLLLNRDKSSAVGIAFASRLNRGHVGEGTQLRPNHDGIDTNAQSR
jgi:hypothetical protein